ncbi:MAG: hypothetical protein V5B40_24560, partial [Candidatus Accumulibacter meliphilus]
TRRCRRARPAGPGAGRRAGAAGTHRRRTGRHRTRRPAVCPARLRESFGDGLSRSFLVGDDIANAGMARSAAAETRAAVWPRRARRAALWRPRPEWRLRPRRRFRLRQPKCAAASMNSNHHRQRRARPRYARAAAWKRRAVAAAGG